MSKSTGQYMFISIYEHQNYVFVQGFKPKYINFNTEYKQGEKSNLGFW